MNRRILPLFMILIAQTGLLAAQAEAKSISVGMPFNEVATLIEEAGGRETMLDVVSLESAEYSSKLFYLPDDRHVSVAFKKDKDGTITGLSSFIINSDVPKGDPKHWIDLQKNAKEIELNSVNIVLKADKINFQAGDTIKLSLEFKNVSEKPVILNAHLLNFDLLRGLTFYNRFEGTKYAIKDTAIYDLDPPYASDFVELGPGQSRTEQFEIRTIIPEPEPLWFAKRAKELNQGTDRHQESAALSKSLAPGTYFIHARYVNDLCGFDKEGTPTQHCEHVKADERAFTGRLVSAGVEITIKERSVEVTSSPASGPSPETLTCRFVTDCRWDGGFPESLGGCGCFSTGYSAKVRQKIAKGIYDSQTFIECEAPPWQDTACLCVEGVCRFDMLTAYDAKTVPASQALDIAKKLVEKEGWKWKDVSIEDEGTAWLIRTGGLQDGGNADIRIDKKSGKVLQKLFNQE